MNYLSINDNLYAMTKQPKIVIGEDNSIHLEFVLHTVTNKLVKDWYTRPEMNYSIFTQYVDSRNIFITLHATALMDFVDSENKNIKFKCAYFAVQEMPILCTVTDVEFNFSSYITVGDKEVELK